MSEIVQISKDVLNLFVNMQFEENTGDVVDQQAKAQVIVTNAVGTSILHELKSNVGQGRTIAAGPFMYGFGEFILRENFTDEVADSYRHLFNHNEKFTHMSEIDSISANIDKSLVESVIKFAGGYAYDDENMQWIVDPTRGQDDAVELDEFGASLIIAIHVMVIAHLLVRDANKSERTVLEAVEGIYTIDWNGDEWIIGFTGA